MGLYGLRQGGVGMNQQAAVEGRGRSWAESAEERESSEPSESLRVKAFATSVIGLRVRCTPRREETK